MVVLRETEERETEGGSDIFGGFSSGLSTFGGRFCFFFFSFFLSPSFDLLILLPGRQALLSSRHQRWKPEHLSAKTFIENAPRLLPSTQAKNLRKLGQLVLGSTIPTLLSALV
jgi:hypothetical protein